MLRKCSITCIAGLIFAKSSCFRMARVAIQVEIPSNKFFSLLIGCLDIRRVNVRRSLLSGFDLLLSDWVRKILKARVHVSVLYERRRIWHLAEVLHCSRSPQRALKAAAPCVRESFGELPVSKRSCNVDWMCLVFDQWSSPFCLWDPYSRTSFSRMSTSLGTSFVKDLLN